MAKKPKPSFDLSTPRATTPQTGWVYRSDVAAPAPAKPSAVAAPAPTPAAPKPAARVRTKPAPIAKVPVITRTPARASTTPALVVTTLVPFALIAMLFQKRR